MPQQAAAETWHGTGTGTAGQSLGSQVQPAHGLTGQQVERVLLVTHGGTWSPPHPAGMVGQSKGEGAPVLQLCSCEVAVGSVHLGTYGEQMDLRAGPVSPSFTTAGASPPCTGITGGQLTRARGLKEPVKGSPLSSGFGRSSQPISYQPKTTGGSTSTCYCSTPSPAPTHSLTKGSEYPLASMAAKCTQRTMPTIRPPCWVLYMRDTRILPRSSTSPPRSTCKRKPPEMGTQGLSEEDCQLQRQDGYKGSCIPVRWGKKESRT